MKAHLLGAVALSCLASPVLAETAPTTSETADAQAGAKPVKAAAKVKVTAWEASRTVDDNDKITTGVAKARDRLSSATSTSSIKENEIIKLAPRSMADLFRNIPGMRVEAAAGEGGNSYTVRGLPLVGEGSKYIQIQEDGLPVLEFGDFNSLQPDSFTRVDMNVAQVESIRGGSSSTFASNAPGGVINLISKTGEVEGGSIQATAGLNFDTKRVDFDYGGHLSSKWRFHLGGFYRTGEGPRATGYNAYKGGQLKFNITRQFDGGYVRFYGKFLDDRSPVYRQYPALISGTSADPKLTNFPGFDLNRDSFYSGNLGDLTTVQPDKTTAATRFGTHAMVKSGGFEAQFKLADWTVTERFRYSGNSFDLATPFPAFVTPPATLGAIFAIPGAAFSYATGPQKGQAFDPAGMLAFTAISRMSGSVDNLTNDIRASRVWSVDGSDLTTTAGLYSARQQLKRTLTGAAVIQTVAGGGNSQLVNVAAFGGVFPVSQDGNLLYNPGNAGSANTINVQYDVMAPYGSLNFQSGRFAIGGSMRYDFGHAKGAVQSASPTTGCVDVNGDGVVIPGTAECQASVFAAGGARPIDYHYGYLSYSAGVNFRLAEPFAMFARYSKGSRAGAEALLFSPAIDLQSGNLLDKTVSRDPVKQAEGGFKYRNNGITLNLTAFYATTDEVNLQINTNAAGLAQQELVSRSYKAYGAEFEGGIRRGPFSITAGATLAKGEITKAETADLVGNTPRHQPRLIYQLTPQYDSDLFTVGANLVGITGSFAQDVNQLRLPAYTTVGLFAQVRPVKRLELSVNASNVFDTKAVTETLDATFPASGIVLARTLYGRLVSASARFFF